jgi:hypothetical protein
VLTTAATGCDEDRAWSIRLSENDGDEDDADLVRNVVTLAMNSVRTSAPCRALASSGRGGGEGASFFVLPLAMSTSQMPG